MELDEPRMPKYIWGCGKQKMTVEYLRFVGIWRYHQTLKDSAAERRMRYRVLPALPAMVCVQSLT